MRVTIESRIQVLEEECRLRIHSLRHRLERMLRIIDKQTGSLNPLGELQSETTVLDCQLATLGCLRELRSGVEKEAARPKKSEDSDAQATGLRCL